MALVYIGLGGNLGDRAEHLSQARNRIYSHGLIHPVRETDIMETEPVDYTQQPRFLNQIIAVETTLGPHALLANLQSIEQVMGRIRTIDKGPRIIDLDILLYDNQIIRTADLIIPHPRIKQRPFILHHLLQLHPELIDPVENRPYRDYYNPGL